MDSYETLLDWFSKTLKDFYNLIAAVSFTVLGYFLPIRNIVYALVVLFIVDVIFGYWNARVNNRESFSKTVIFSTTVPRLLVTIVLIMITHMWDTEFGQEAVSTPNLIGWFIGGVLIVSIGKNMFKVTNWGPILQVIDSIKISTKDKTHMDIKDDEDDNYRE